MLKKWVSWFILQADNKKSILKINLCLMQNIYYFVLYCLMLKYILSEHISQKERKLIALLNAGKKQKTYLKEII